MKRTGGIGKTIHGAAIAALALWALAGCSSSVNVKPSEDIVPVIVGPVDRIGGEPSILNAPCAGQWFRSWKINYFILGKSNVFHTTLTKWVGQPYYGSITLEQKRRVHLRDIQASTAGGGLLFLINASQSRLSMNYALCNSTGSAQ